MAGPVVISCSPWQRRPRRSTSAAASRTRRPRARRPSPWRSTRPPEDASQGAGAGRQVQQHRASVREGHRATGSTVYLAELRHLGGLARKGVAAADAVTGAALPFDAKLSSGSCAAEAPEPAAAHGHPEPAYIAGGFTLADGAPRTGAAAVDARERQAIDVDPGPGRPGERHPQQRRGHRHRERLWRAAQLRGRPSRRGGHVSVLADERINDLVLGPGGGVVVVGDFVEDRRARPARDRVIARRRPPASARARRSSPSATAGRPRFAARARPPSAARSTRRCASS